MKIEIKILKPKRWKENFLVNALTKEDIPREYFVDNIGEDAEILVSNSLYVEELNRLRKLKHLIIPTSGTESICIGNVFERGIKVYHDPSITSKGVADYVVHNLEEILGNETVDFMRGATVGLLGFGNVGKEIYGSLRKFGCRFEAFTKKTNPYHEIKTRKGKADLMTLISSCNIIINALPLSKETDNLLYGKNSQIRREALVISVSRVGIIDDYAILGDVLKGNLRGAILDVYSDEINPNDYSNKNIILTPHLAGIYGEALNNIVGFVKRSIKETSGR